MQRTLALLIACALMSACSNQLGAAPPAGRAAMTRSVAHAADSGTALPGDSGTALPGAQLACVPNVATGSASCSIAININIAPIGSPTTPASMIPGLHPADLQNAYTLPGSDAGERVAVVDAYDDPAAESDLNVYRTAFGLPVCTTSNGCFSRVNESGATDAYPAPSASWSQEIALDLEMISAMCPRCSILLVEANSASLDDLGTAVDTAVAQGARVVSNSYYSAEWSGETAEDAHFAHAGVVMTASSGDQDYPSYPAASPYVVSVGGTTLEDGSEQPWTFSGHGCSAYERAVRWQNGLTGCTTRSAVDVAAVADPQGGVAIFDSTAGGWLVAGGTSVGAPIVAAAYALAHNGAAAPFTYAHASSLHHIGGSAYGLYTGLGSPSGLNAF